MVTQTPNQLSHDEAFELLPWHLNATLEEPLSDLVAHHVEQCATCQEESAVLSTTIVTLNASDAPSTNLDGRFSKLLGRVRDYEQSHETAVVPDKRPLGLRFAEWLGLSPPRMQWAGAFTLGLAVGIGALLATLQTPEFEVHSSDPQALYLQVEFGRAPSAEILTTLEQATGETAEWQQQSDTRFLVELSDETTVKSVADIRSRLLAHDSVTAVAIDIDGADRASD